MCQWDVLYCFNLVLVRPSHWREQKATENKYVLIGMCERRRRGSGSTTDPWRSGATTTCGAKRSTGSWTWRTMRPPCCPGGQAQPLAGEQGEKPQPLAGNGSSELAT